MPAFPMSAILMSGGRKIFADVAVSEEVPDEPITMAARMKVQAAAMKTKTRCGPSSG